MNAFDGKTGGQLQRALMVGAWLLAALIAVAILYVLSSLHYVGEGITPSDTISVSGTGYVYAIPDTGEFSFSVVADASTVSAAQAVATTKINALTQYLLSAGVAQSDIQTTDYEINPTYKNEPVACPVLAPTSGAVGMPTIYCPPSGNQVQTGYEVQQTTDVKVRDTSQAGDLLAGVGSKGATNISGLSFTVEDPTSVEAQARDKAIADAKTKADALAQSLGVSLVRVVSFSENEGGVGPLPIYSMAAASGSNAPATPNISTGQNKITDNVSITYEIR